MKRFLQAGTFVGAFLLASGLYAAAPVISDVTIAAGAYKIGSAITITIVADGNGYTLDPSTVNGVTVTGFTDNMDHTYTVTYTVGAGDMDRGSVGAIPIVIKLRNGPGPTNLTTYTTAPTSGGTVTIDAHAPVISSVTSNANSAGALKIGQTIIFTATITTPETGLVLAPTTYNGRTFAPSWATSDGGAHYTATYTVTSGDPDQTSALQLTGVTATDAAGNASGSVSTSNVVKTIDAHAPVISSVTSDANSAGVLKIGQTIIFTATITTPETGLVLAPTTYNGRTFAPSWATADAGATYTATYTVTSGDPDQTSALQLTGVTATDAAGNTSGSVSTSNVVKTIDANAPSFTLASNASSAGVLKIGQTIVFTATMSIAETGLVFSPTTYNGRTFAPSWATSDGGAHYTATYTVTSGDPDQTSALQLTGVTATDAAGNTSGSVSTSNVVKTIDANAPVISSVTSDANSAGVLKIGQTIIFTATITTPETGLVLVPTTYNGRTFAPSWATADAGATYTATYTVTSGDPDQTSALQLTGVTATDAAGNASGAVSTSNVVKTIDAHAPSVTGITLVSSSPTNASSVDYTVVFSEDVTGVDVSDFSLTVTGTPGGTVSNVLQNTPSNYTVTVNSITASGTIRLDLKSSGTGITDIATNPISGGFTTGSVYTIDKVFPAALTVGSLTTTGGTVVATYWNATNTGINVVVPLTNTDASLGGGTVQIQIQNTTTNTWVNVGGILDGVGSGFSTITNPQRTGGTKTISISAANLEGTAGFIEGLVGGSAASETQFVQVRAVVTDLAGNSTNWTKSATNIDVDQTPPTITSASFFASFAHASDGDYTDCSGTAVNNDSNREYAHLVMSEALGIANGVTPTIQTLSTGTIGFNAANYSGSWGGSNYQTFSGCSNRGGCAYHTNSGASPYVIHLEDVFITGSTDGLWTTSTTFSFVTGGTNIKDPAGNELASVPTITPGASAPKLASSMVFNPNGTGNEIITFTVDQALNTSTTANAVTGITVDADGSGPGAAVSVAGTYSTSGNVITLNSSSDNQWSTVTTISYSAAGNLAGATGVAMGAFTSEPILLGPVTIASNNALNTALAKQTETITITFKANSALSATPTATIGGLAATVSGSFPNYTAAIVTDGTVPNAVVAFDINATQSGRSTDVTVTSDGSSVTYDNIAPATPTAPDLAPTSDSNINNDNITNISTNLVFQGANGTVENNALVQVFDNTTLLGTTTATATGSWTFTYAGTLADGTHPINIKARDAAGNLSSASLNLNVTVDTTPPVASSIAISSTLKGIGITNGIVASSVSFLVTFTEANTPLTGIDPTDFTVSKDATVSYTPPLVVTGSGATRTITINGISGTGKISLGLTDDNTILDTPGNPLDGAADGSIAPSYTGTQYYTIVLPQPAIEAITVNSTTVTSSAITLTWNGTATVQVPTNFLVLAKPTSGGSYPTVADGTPVADGALAKNTTYVLGTNTYTFTGLNSGTSYDFIVYKYTLSPNNSSDNIDFETTTPGVKNGVATNSASVSWMTKTTGAAPISSTSSTSGTSTSVMSFTIYDDGLNPISPNVMNFYDNGSSPETITFTLTDQLLGLVNGSSVTGFTSSSGAVASAIYTGAGTTNTITLTSGADGQWTQATTISYSATTGNAQFITLGKMQSIANHALVPILLTYAAPGSYSFTVPVGVTSITVETWGAGGSGGPFIIPTLSYGAGSTSGGGGGGYSRSVIAVTPGTVYNVSVGAGGAPAPGGPVYVQAGNDGVGSYFGSTSLVYAAGGNGGWNNDWTDAYSTGVTAYGVHGFGGSSASGVGDVTYSGGNAGIGYGNGGGSHGTLYGYGGGGGSSAGTGSNGNIGSNGFTCCASSPGGSTPIGGGGGGSGVYGQAGFAGSFPGGGGGGTSGVGPYNSGGGANGQVKVTCALPASGPTDWSLDNSPFKFSQIVITQAGAINSGSPNNDWTQIIAGAELNDGTNTFNSITNPSDVHINSTDITFSNLPSTTSADIGYIPDATSSLSSKTYTLKIWLKNNLSNAIAVQIDNKNLGFKFDATVAANLTYDDVTNSAQKSSRLASPEPNFNSGAAQIQVLASKLVYNTAGNSPTNTNPQTQIGVGIPFANSSAQFPEVYALDANNNLDLDYDNATNFNTGTISNPLQSFGQSVTSLPFVNGKLTLKTLDFTTGSPTVLNTQIVVAGNGSPTVTSATSTNIWPVISDLTTLSAGTLPASELASFPSTTNSLPANFNFDFIVTDDVGADATGFTNNDALPTIIQTVTITQDPNNSPAINNWTQSILGAQLRDVNTGISVNASSINAASLVFNLPAGMQTVPDGGSQTYQLRIWLQNPVDPTLVDILDNTSFAFAINDTNLSLGAASTTSVMTGSSTNTGIGRNVVTVTASQLDFVTSPSATQYYDTPFSPTPAAKAHDANGNLDLDYTSGNGNSASVVTSLAGLTLGSTPVTVSGGLLSFNSNLQVSTTGAAAETDGASSQLKLSGAGAPAVSSGLSTSFTLNYSHNSDIVQDNVTPFVYPTNILYASANNQAVAPLTNANGIALEQFLVRDGGASHSDADGSPTVLTSITLDVANYLNLRELALFNGVTNIAEVSVIPTNYTVVGGKARIIFSGFTFSAAKNTDAPLTIKGSFIGNGVVDNQVISFSVVSVQAQNHTSSQFANASPSGIQSIATGNQNKIEVVATQITYTTVPTSASINVPLTVVVQAQDGNLNLDADYNGAISIPGAHPNGNTSDYTVLNLPSGSFSGGIVSYPVGPPPSSAFQFTSGAVSTQLVIDGGAANTGGASVDAGAITGISPVITVITSFESFITKEPTFIVPATIPYVTHQEINGNLTGSSYELIRVLLLDGSRSSTATYGPTHAPLQFQTPTDTDGQLHGDNDGASTNLGSITIQISNPSNLRTIGLFDKNGVQLGSQIDVTALALTTGAAPQNFTFTGSPLLTAPDDSSAVFSVRASFNNTNTTLKDGDDIQIQLIAASIVPSSGSDFYNGPIGSPGLGGPYVGGQKPGTPPTLSLGLIDVIATSLDFTTQPSPYAGINEPVGPTYTTAPLPSTSAAIVRARDKYTLLDSDFNYPVSSITVTDNAGDNISSPAAFVSGILNLDGMKYATPGDGTLRVQANGLDSNLTPNGSSTPGFLVNVINVAATYNGIGVLGNGTPAPATSPVSIKGGSLGQTIFGVTFTASGTTATDPKLKKFSISFNIPYTTSSRTIFSNFVVRESANDITALGGNLVLSSSKGNSDLDSITVDLSANPRAFDPSTHQLTYYLIADVDPTANISTPPIIPSVLDGGYLSLTDKNIVVTEGTASGTVDGNVYSFASTKPPVLITAKNTAHPNQTSRPYNGQLNVSALLDSIHLRFDTKVISLDGVAELWSRNPNIKVADLIARINPGNSPTVNGNFLSTGDYKTVDNPLPYFISFLPGHSFKPDSVYYVTIKKGDFDPLANPPSGHGISDEGLNFYGGIASNSTLYFKISSDQPILLSQSSGKIYNTSVASISTKFDQFGTAYYLVLPSAATPPSSYTQVKTPSTYPIQAQIAASGSYAIDQINTLQTETFPAITSFIGGQAYNVYLYAENDANPTPISAGGIYGSNLVANGPGATLQLTAPAAPVANTPFYLICPGSFVTVSDPILLGESSPSAFSSGTLLNPTNQDFNILLPTGYEFDGITLPDVKLIGADFNGAQATRSFVSNTVLKVSYKNFGSASIDYIVISNLLVIGSSGSASQPILRFYGSNTSFASPTATVATIGLFPSKTFNFNNSYSSDPNNIFPAGSPAFVDAIPDNYVDADPNISGSIRLIPIISIPNDFNASIFEGTGVTNDLLTLSAVPTNAAFNITMNHTDPNGCNTQASQQYLVYDHNSPISKKLGVSNSVVNLPGTVQALVNTAFPNPSPALLSSQTIFDNELAGYELKSLSANVPASVTKGQESQIMSGTDWQAQIQKIPSIAGSVTNVFGTFYSYKWDYSHILNALTEPGANPGGSIKVDPYYGELSNPFNNQTAVGNQYWKGGSLGQVEFTGLFQSTADLTVYIPFRQDVELFVPAVPIIEVASSNQSSSDASDGTVNGGNSQTAYNYIKNTFGFQYTNTNGYLGTSIFCEKGGTITLNGYPAALAGTSTGTFAIYDFQSYDFGGFKTGTITTQPSSSAVTGTGTSFSTELKVGSILSDASGNVIGNVQSITDNLHLTLTSSAAITIASAQYQAIFNTALVAPQANSAFVDNGNGSMTLNPSNIKNNYDDILVAYTYQENVSPAFGIGYLVIRVTPNPLPQFTISSTVANPGASAFDKFCLGSLVTFDASVSTIATSSVTSNVISQSGWDFGDPNSATQNNATGPNATHTYKISSIYPVNLSLVSNWGCPSLPNIVAPTPLTNTVLYPGSGGNITVGDNPTVDFSFAGNCVDAPMTFKDNSSTPTGSNSKTYQFNWYYDFVSNPTAVFTGYNLTQTIKPPVSNVDGQNVSTTYTTSGFYSVRLTTITTLGCQNSDTTYISQLAVTNPFNQYFDSDDGGWQTIDLANNSPGPGNVNVSWAWGSTSGRTNSVFDSPSGNKMWVTSAIPTDTTGFYNPLEKSALYSACLNLDSTIVPRPMISFSSFVDVNGADGLVLQYSTDNLNILDPAKQWTNLGGIGSGLDWYTSVGLASNPGSNNSAGIGWSGSPVVLEGKKWIHPKHKLDNLSPNTQKLILRFALSSVASSTVLSNSTTPYDGVAIDSVFFGSRTRTILFENFTTTDDGGSGLNSVLLTEADSITAFVNRNITGTQLVNINYHVGFIGQDPFNLDNPADPSSRALYYNVNKVPYAFLDGIHYRDSTKTPPSDLFKDWGQGEYDLNTLQLAKADFLDPSPSTKLTTVTSNPDGSLQVDVNFTPVFDLPYSPVIPNTNILAKGGTVLQVAILEKQITTIPTNGKVTTGETSFGYVLKKMLPNAAGTKFPSPILGIETNGTTHPVSVGGDPLKWTPKNLHSNMLTVVVFLQNEDTKEVYQAFIQDDIPVTAVTAIEPITADNIKVYPNPSDQEFTIELPSPAQQNMKITMANQLGQFTEMGSLNEGEQSKRISTQGLAEGVYILQLGSNGNALRTKVVVLHK